MKYFEINLEESKCFSVSGKTRWKNPMVKVCVKKEIPKGACVLKKEIRDQNGSWKLYQSDLELMGSLNIVRSMDWLWDPFSSCFSRTVGLGY